MTSLVLALAGGESIYRIIEPAHCARDEPHRLYARYVEKHTGAVREMLRRVGEDLGRAEGVVSVLWQCASSNVHAHAERVGEAAKTRGCRVSRAHAAHRISI
ncbi:hypothetical protein C8R45DRAFT_327261 [Mycena sanguinolenta]|nr:hypothetical protein C8R45DRAFT_327261 [Mycena sanguinolenta]